MDDAGALFLTREHFMDLRQQLEDVLRGSVCLVGIGNADYGDDGFGVHLAARLSANGIRNVVAAGNTPERYLGRLVERKYDCVLFLDAVDFGGAPGSLVLLNSGEMACRFPQVSTHKISLGLLAKWAEGNGVGEIWLLGAQPGSFRRGHQLSPTLQASSDVVACMLADILNQPEVARSAERPDAGVNS